MPGRILVIDGPTASGKTDLAVELALRHCGEVVSADSMQVYRHMDIGTAKPTPEEMRGVPHHMLDVAEPGENFSVSRYVEMATRCVDGILARGRLPIVAGGTGLYIDSLVSGRTFAPAPDPALRRRLEASYDALGGEALLSRLAREDPETAARLHPRDRKRIVRALEVLETSGRPLSAHDRDTRARPPRYEAVTLTLTYADRAVLRERIDRRVDRMMAAGLPEEVRGLLDRGVPPDCTAMQAIGYKEMAAALREGRDPETAAEEIRLRSRQYAKRQLSWFRRNPEARWLLRPEGDTPEALADRAEALLRSREG